MRLMRKKYDAAFKAKVAVGAIKAGYYGQSELHVRNGKGSKSREVQTTGQLKWVIPQYTDNTDICRRDEKGHPTKP